MYRSNRVVCPSGTTGNNIYLWLPALGNSVKRVFAQNASNGAGPVTLAVCAIGSIDVSAPSKVASIGEDHIPLNVDQQLSPAEWVKWEGNQPKDENYPYIVAQFNDASDGDTLILKVWYE